VDVDRPLAACSASLRQMTAIARAVSEGARLIIMDEPTSSLDEAEVERLLDTVRGLRASGVATLFVTHRLDEFYAVCEGITVLRDGATVHEGPLADLPRSELVHRMVGRAVPGAGAGRAARPAPMGAPWLAARGLSDGQRVRAVSLDLRPGEVLGLAGLLGSGRSETARMIFADIRPDGGEVRVEGAARAPASPRAAIALGFGFCGEDRKTDGIVPLLSVRDNLTLALLPRLARLGIVGRRRQRAVVAEFIERLGIRTASMDQPIRELSGGNQQKVLLARWMAMAPRLLILDEPTRGIDVGAKAEIQRIAGEMAARGASILLVSSEIEELIAQADRVVVLRDGRDVALVEGEAITEGALVHAMAQGHAAEAAT
jgi:ribose transport system ATP-binding protein